MPMTKHDYIANVSDAEQWLATIALLVATLVSAACLLLVIGAAIVGIIDVSSGPFLGCVAIFGPLTTVCGWMLIRMLRRRRASNGRTVMPDRFIQLFGFVFLIGICATAILNGRLWLFGEALGVALAMIGVRKLLRDTNPNEDAANHRMHRRTGGAFDPNGDPVPGAR